MPSLLTRWLRCGYACGPLGALSAGTWATLVHFGQKGYTAAIKQILDAAQVIARGTSESVWSHETPAAAVPCTFPAAVVVAVAKRRGVMEWGD